MGLLIIIAWIETESFVVRERATDLGERPLMGTRPAAKTVTWCLDGNDVDLEKAKRFANDGSEQTKHVFTYPVTMNVDQAHEKANANMLDTHARKLSTLIEKAKSGGVQITNAEFRGALIHDKATLGWRTLNTTELASAQGELRRLGLMATRTLGRPYVSAAERAKS